MMNRPKTGVIPITDDWYCYYNNYEDIAPNERLATPEDCKNCDGFEEPCSEGIMCIITGEE